MGTVGFQLIQLQLPNEMCKYRRIVRTPNSKLQSHQIILVTLIVNLFLSIVLSMLYFKINIYMVYTVTCISYIILLLLFIFFIISIKNTEQVSTLDIEKMNKKSNSTANKIKKLFNDKNITDVLKLSNTKRYGEEMPEIYVYIDNSLNEGYVAINHFSKFAIASIKKNIPTPASNTSEEHNKNKDTRRDLTNIKPSESNQNKILPRTGVSSSSTILFGATLLSLALISRKLKKN